MTPQEQQMLQGLTDRINQTTLSEKDPEAEQFLFQTLGRNSDSLYILAQTVLVQQYALDQTKKQLDDAKQQLEQARQQAAQPAKHTSFLGSLLGTDEPAHPAPPPPPPAQYSQPQYGQPQYAPVPNYPAQPSYAQPTYAQASPMPQSGGFLRSAMTTATGVAAGALAFEGIEGLMHGFEHSGGYGGGAGLGGFGGQGRPEEVVNNYYGDSSSFGDRAEHAPLSPDIEDRRDAGANNFADTSYESDDSSGAADYGTDSDSTDFGSGDSGNYGTDDSGS